MSSFSGEGDASLHSSVNAVVLKRVRQLEASLTKANREVEDLTGQLKVLRKQYDTAVERLEDQKQLVDKLERQLEANTMMPGAAVAGELAEAKPLVSSKAAASRPFSQDAQLLAVLGACLVTIVYRTPRPCGVPSALLRVCRDVDSQAQRWAQTVTRTW